MTVDTGGRAYMVLTPWLTSQLDSDASRRGHSLERYLKENHIPYVNRENLKDMEEIRHLINSELARLVNSSKGFKSYEQVSRFALLEKPFTVGRELSAKQEVKRAEVMTLYKEEVESIFR